MLQPNIVRNKTMTKYFDWFEFASKTKNKNNVAADFKKYRKDKIFSTMIEQLRTTVLEDDDFQYIEDYDEYMIGVQNYNNKIRREALKEADELFKPEREQARAEREQARAEREQARRKQENTVRNMRQRGFSVDVIADITELSVAEINDFFEAFDKAK
jgi:vacuolar-type H+-ATPase subunit H